MDRDRDSRDAGRFEAARSHGRPFAAVIALALALALVVGGLAAGASATAHAEEERTEGYYTLVDQAGNDVFVTAIVLAPGDVFIDEHDQAHEVTEIEGDTARSRLIEVGAAEVGEASRLDGFLGRLGRVVASIRDSLLARRGQGRATIVLYNSHSDESYKPTSGTATKDWGDVYRVAAALESALEKKGFDVVRSTANHNPHDGAAYARSRRTLARLLRTRPTAAFDIHRDAVPPEAYRAEVAGEDVTRITLVVGQQNQTRGQNIEFARRLKSAADASTPGLIKGILWAQGNYNQDLLGRSALIEVGAHTNRLDEAERAVDLFAASIASAVAGPGAPRGAAPMGGARAAAWIVGLALAGGGVYLLANARGWKKVRARLSSIGVRGLMNLFGRMRRKRR